MLQEIEKLKTDPENKPSCSTRKKMAWFSLVTNLLVYTTSIFYGQDSSIVKYVVIYSTILTICLVLFYSVSRLVLDKFVLEALKLIGEKGSFT